MADPDILVDARWDGPHGIGRFAREILQRLPGARRLDASTRPLALLEPWRLSRRLAAQRADIFFTPGFNAPLAPPYPAVFCLHDLIHLALPGLGGALRRAWYERILKPAGRRAARVLTVSEESRRRILAWSGWPADHVLVVGNGVSDVFTPHGPRADLGQPYILHVGNAKPHKNRLRLIEAFAVVASKRPVQLVVNLNLTPRETALASRLGLDDRIVPRPATAEPDLAALYRGASCVVLPSLEEGFGLPVIEAMACATPVVASKPPHISTEVVGPAMLVDPLDPVDIARGIHEALQRTSDDAARQRLIAHAARFRWDDVAVRVRDALRRAAS
jgi:glycosyltransferase involved in cell wall biosynthesis